MGDSSEEKESENSLSADYWQGKAGFLRRAVAYVYSKILSSKKEGGLREWLDEHCLLFSGVKKNEEQPVECYELYLEYEKNVDMILEAFVEKEFEGTSRREKIAEVREYIQTVALNKSIDSTISMLIAAADYNKFTSIMRRRAKAKAFLSTAAAPKPSLTRRSSSSAKADTAEKIDDDTVIIPLNSPQAAAKEEDGSSLSFLSSSCK